MQLDPDHVAVLSKAISVDDAGREYVALDTSFMLDAMFRLNLWERGLLTQVLFKALGAKKKSPEQRALVALFVARDQEDTEEDQA